MEQLQQITLETLPKAFMHLLDEVKELKTLLIQKNQESQPIINQWFEQARQQHTHAPNS